MRKDIADKHINCQLEIRWKTFKGQDTPTPALFCSDHNEFLDWLPTHIAYELIDVDGVPVEMWQDKPKKKSKKPKVLTASPLPKPKQTLRQRKSKKIRLKEKNIEYKKRFGIAI